MSSISSSTPSTTIFYCNGILTDRNGNENDSKKIKEIIENKLKKNVCVESHFNDTSTPSKVLSTLGPPLYNSLFAPICCGLEIEAPKDENECALKLVKKVKERLIDTSKKVVLILHSHAAKIGFLAMNDLDKYKNRINVITLGGMFDINGTEVINLRIKYDVINLLVPCLTKMCKTDSEKKVESEENRLATIQNSRVQWIDITFNISEPYSHLPESYLSLPEFEEALRKFI